MTDSPQIICANCKVRIELRDDSDNQKIAFCPTCGANDMLENVLREATEHGIDKIANSAFSELNAALNHQFMEVAIKQGQERPRFIFDGDLH